MIRCDLVEVGDPGSFVGGSVYDRKIKVKQADESEKKKNNSVSDLLTMKFLHLQYL